MSFAALFGRLDLLAQLIARGADPTRAEGWCCKMAIQQGNRESAAALERTGTIPHPEETIRTHP